MMFSDVPDVQNMPEFYKKSAILINGVYIGTHGSFGIKMPLGFITQFILGNFTYYKGVLIANPNPLDFGEAEVNDLVYTLPSNYKDVLVYRRDCVIGVYYDVNLHRTCVVIVSRKPYNLTIDTDEFKKDILNFKERIETLGKEEAEKLGFLQNELKSLKDLSYKLSSDAQDLTRALKGETKKQGMWGEVVLERVLEMSGLREGSEYVREKSFVDDENKRYRPDVIVYLPQDRQVIVDAKTSLNAYSHYIKAEDEEQKKQYLLAHIKAIKNHIDVLAKKKYEDLEGVNSLDFVFIFVPIENALMLALENDVELFEYAFRKRVILVSPTTLLVSLRSIESSWRSERQAKNIAEVVHSAEKLYDKVRGFVEDFDKIGKHIENFQKVYESAKNKLISGRGNVIRQIESLKQKAGIKPKTEIPKEYNLDLIESEK
jgi:DNA recombination protein RmuC